MKNLNCYIVDNEFHSIRMISHYIELTEGLKLIQSFNKPLLALDTIVNDLTPTLTFLDLNILEMPPDEFIKAITPYTEIVITTTLLRHEVMIDKNESSDFLFKPISYERFLKCMKKFN